MTSGIDEYMHTTNPFYKPSTGDFHLQSDDPVVQWERNMMSIVMKYARCQVWPGMFDSEVYVIIGDVSAIVDKRSVKTDSPVNGVEVSGAVLVHLIEEKSGKALIELPGQPVVGGLRTWVPKETLAATQKSA